MLDKERANDNVIWLIEQCQSFKVILGEIKIWNLNFVNLNENEAPVVVDINSDDWRIFIKKVYKLFYENLQTSNETEKDYIDTYERIKNDIHIWGVTENVIMDLNVLFHDVLEYIKYQ